MSEMNFEEQYERAVAAGEEANRTEARATGARYDPEMKMIVIDLRGGGAFSFPVAWVRGLREAAEEDIAQVQITPSGEGLHWEKLDEDLSVPALISGSYGPAGRDRADLEQLCIRLESSWFSDRDASIVDRLATENPHHSAELYEFFADLIGSELAATDGEGAARSAELARAWLEAEGFDSARRAARGPEGAAPPTASSTPPLAGSEPPRAATPNPELQQGPIGNVLQFDALLRERTGLETHEAYERMGVREDMIFALEQQDPEKQLRIREDVEEKAETIFGIERAETRESLGRQFARAARDRSHGPPPSFREQLAAIEMTDEEMEHWMGLADEEDDA